MISSVGTQQTFFFPNLHFSVPSNYIKRRMCSLKIFKFPLTYFMKFLDISKRIIPESAYKLEVVD